MTTDKCPMTDAAEQARTLRVDVCPECESDEKAWRVTQGTGDDIIGTCQHKWHDQPAPKPAAPVSARLLAKYQPCGCVICTCENDEQCQGCGAKHCGTHAICSIPNPVYQAAPVSATPKSDDMAALIRRLCRAVKRLEPGNTLPAQAMRYLQTHGLTGAILRDEDLPDQDIEETLSALESEIVKNARIERELAEAKMQINLNYHVVACIKRNAESAEARAAELQAKLAAETARADGAHNAAIDKCHGIFDKAFENNWVVQDTLDTILALKVPQ